MKNRVDYNKIYYAGESAPLGIFTGQKPKRRDRMKNPTTVKFETVNPDGRRLRHKWVFNGVVEGNIDWSKTVSIGPHRICNWPANSTNATLSKGFNDLNVNCTRSFAEIFGLTTKDKTNWLRFVWLFPLCLCWSAALSVLLAPFTALRVAFRVAKDRTTRTVMVRMK